MHFSCIVRGKYENEYPDRIIDLYHGEIAGRDIQLVRSFSSKEGVVEYQVIKGMPAECTLSAEVGELEDDQLCVYLPSKILCGDKEIEKNFQEIHLLEAIIGGLQDLLKENRMQDLLDLMQCKKEN